MRRSVRIGALAFLGFTVLGVPTVWAQSPPDVTIDGNVQILGCAVSPADITVYADLLVPSSALDIRPVEFVATGENAGDGRMAYFSFTGLQAGDLYQLRIKASPSSPCGPIRWQGPRRGLVRAGQRGVQIFGYALRSELDVLGLSGEGRRSSTWVGADNLDLADPGNTLRQFRWRTSLPGVVGGVLQVATEPFPLRGETGAACSNPPALVYSARFAAETGAWSFPRSVNFTSVAARFVGGSRLRPLLIRSLSLGAPWYVRVVPITADGVLCDSNNTGPAPTVVLANVSSLRSRIGTPSKASGGPLQFLPQSTFQEPWYWPNHPTGLETGFRVIKPHFLNPFTLNPNQDFYGTLAYYWALGQPTPPWSAPGWLEPGDRFFHYNSSGGAGLADFIDSFVSVISGVIDAVGSLADWISKAWADIQNAVAAVVTDALSFTGVCKLTPDCRGLVQLAMQTGLAAMGLPPSLPNWDAIVNGGEEYLAAELVSEAGLSNVPGANELTTAAVKTLVTDAVNKMNDNRGSSGGTGVDWLFTDLGEEPAVLHLEISAFDQGQPLPDKIRITGNVLFHGADVPLPKQWPSDPLQPNVKRLSVPVALQPNIDEFFYSFNDDWGRAVAAKAYFFQTKLPTYSCATFGGLLLKTTGGSLDIPVGSVPPFSVFVAGNSGRGTGPNGDAPVPATVSLVVPPLGGCAK